MDTATATPASRRGARTATDVRILVFDDDPNVCRFIQDVVTPDGYTVQTVQRASEGIELLSREIFDVVFLDLNIPGAEDDMLIEQVADLSPEAAIIIVTGYPSVETAIAGIRSNVNDYLVKPLMPRHIREALLRALRRKGLHRLPKESLYAIIGSRVREVRKRQGLTQRDLGQSANLSIGFLSQLEAGKTAPSLDTLYRIAASLNLKLADLLADL